MFIVAATTWSDAFAIVGVAFAAAFAIWAMFKYGDTNNVSEIKISEQPMYYSCEEKPVAHKEVDINPWCSYKKEEPVIKDKKEQD